MNFLYPTAAETFELMPDLDKRARAGRLFLDLFPTKPRKTFFVRWVQRDNYYGLMQMRGLDGAPPKIQSVGSKTYVYEPGVYGEHDVITEREWLTKADPTDMTRRVDMTDEVIARMNLLTNRKLDRMEYNSVQLCANGTITIPLAGPNGQEIYTDTYSIQRFTATVPWGTVATATPIADMQAMQQKSVGHGIDFGAGAIFVVNQVKANQLLNNTNTADFGGRRNQAGATLNNLDAFNNYFQGQGLPKVVVYDKGWQLAPLSGGITSPSTQFQKFLDNNTGILIGKRLNGDPVGEWQQTVQAMQPGNAGPGEYTFVKDYAKGVNAPMEVPPRLEVHHGFNGGLALYYPSAIVSAAI